MQLKWLLGAVAEVPLSQQVIDAHFDSIFLSKVSANKINSVLAQDLVTPSGASLVGLLSKDPTSLVAVAAFGTGNWQVSISVDDAGSSVVCFSARMFLRPRAGLRSTENSPLLLRT